VPARRRLKIQQLSIKQARSAESWAVPTLTRRRSNNPHLVTWHVYYGDVRVGWIGLPIHAKCSSAHDPFCLVWVMKSGDSHANRRKKNSAGAFWEFRCSPPRNLAVL
jgi:hypothetical protein